MGRLDIATFILAPLERCFDLARSIDLHTASTDWTGERAIAGTTAGLIGKDEEVTFQGRHFGFTFQHTSQITAFERPHFFQDCMIRGAFKSFCHDHRFHSEANGTVMLDSIQFRAPLGLLGLTLEPLLKRHLRNLLNRRNECIKRTAEGNSWQRFLSPEAR